MSKYKLINIVLFDQKEAFYNIFYWLAMKTMNEHNILKKTKQLMQYITPVL